MQSPAPDSAPQKSVQVVPDPERPYSRRSRTALIGLVGISMTLAGCGGSTPPPPHEQSARAVVHLVPFAAAASIAAPEHAAVASAVRALAAAELTLSGHVAPLAKANNFTAYLTALAGAAAQSRAAVVDIARQGGDCSRVSAGVSAATTGMFDGAMAQFAARVSLLHSDLGRINTDRVAVTKAAAALTAALVKDPHAWRVPGVDEIDSTLTAIATWQTEVTAAISMAEGKAAGYTAARARIAGRALAVGDACRRAATREAGSGTERSAVDTSATTGATAGPPPAAPVPAPPKLTPGAGHPPAGNTSHRSVAHAGGSQQPSARTSHRGGGAHARPYPSHGRKSRGTGRHRPPAF